MQRYSSILLLLALSSAWLDAQWTQTAGPEGGSAASFLSDGTTLFAGTLGAGVFRSTDGGATWEQKISGMGYQAVNAMAKSGPFVLATGTVGVYRSSDNGEQWTLADGTPAGNGMSSFAVAGDTVLAGSMGKGVYRSTDNGATWTSSSTGLPHGSTQAQIGDIIIAGGVVFASASDNSTVGVFRSTTMGDSWTMASTGITGFTNQSALLSDGTALYAGGPTVYKSTNGGDTWTPAATGLPPDPLISIFHLVGSTIYAAGSPFCYQTTDAGAHWESLGGLPRETMLAFGSHGATLLAGTIYDGIFSSADGGGTWTEASGGFRARDMVNFLADGAALYANGQGAFRTTDGGAAWERVTATLPDSLGPLSAVYADGATIFVQDGAAGGKLHRTTDGGAAWTQASSGLSAFSPVADILLSGGRLLAAASDVYVSSDNGDSWTVSIAGMGTFSTITRLTPAGGTIYASGNGVYRSTDNGDNWSPARAGIPNFYSVDAFAAAGADLFAGSKYAAAIYRSTNSGDSWTPVTSLPFGGACTSFLARGAALFAMSPNNGIFLSVDRGGTWSGVSGNLPDHTYLYSLAEIGGTLYAGCGAENGVWTRPLSDLTAIEDGPGFLPSGYVLSQNYPNPFNPATTVAFSVPAAGPALLTVVDLFGRVVATLVSGELRPGTYRAAWNAGTAPSGVYYFRLQLGGEVRTRAALLLK